jgi:hypothetical protein
MGGAGLVLVVVTGVAVAVGGAAGLSPGRSAGTFAGALTSTPALATAAERSGTDEPAVGYSLSYPVGVVVTIDPDRRVPAEPALGPAGILTRRLPGAGGHLGGGRAAHCPP